MQFWPATHLTDIHFTQILNHLGSIHNLGHRLISDWLVGVEFNAPLDTV